MGPDHANKPGMDCFVTNANNKGPPKKKPAELATWNQRSNVGSYAPRSANKPSTPRPGSANATHSVVAKKVPTMAHNNNNNKT
jgi:hypothetical protein